MLKHIETGGQNPIATAMPAPVVSSGALIRAFTSSSGKLYLLYGGGGIFPLALTVAARAMADGASIAVVDGGNRFDVHLLTRFARVRKIDPDGFLRKIFISRGFTCYQMEQALVSRLPAFLPDIGARAAMVFGLLDTFYDEQASTREVQEILRRVMTALRTMKENGFSVLIACTDVRVMPQERNQLLGRLKEGMDRVYRFEIDPTKSRSILMLEKPAVRRATQRSTIPDVPHMVASGIDT
jgi:hypothetical protein